jgi:hypothetical protein
MKNGCECFDKLSVHGFSSGNSSSGPLVLSLSKDSERVIGQLCLSTGRTATPEEFMIIDLFFQHVKNRPQQFVRRHH